MRLAAKRDLNEQSLIACAEKLGALWVQAPPLDGWVAIRGSFYPVEIKSSRGKLTEAQSKFIQKCMANKAPYFIWRTESDVVRDLSYGF